MTKTVEIFATSNFSFVENAAGDLRLVDKNRVHHLPDPVAEYAVAAEVALLTSTPEGKAAIEDDRLNRLKPVYAGRTPLGQPVYYRLGDVMGLMT